jgi:hypothetical protein
MTTLPSIQDVTPGTFVTVGETFGARTTAEYCSQLIDTTTHVGILAADGTVHAVPASAAAQVESDPPTVAEWVAKVRDYFEDDALADFLDDPGGWLDYAGIAGGHDVAYAVIERIRGEREANQ